MQRSMASYVANNSTKDLICEIMNEAQHKNAVHVSLLSKLMKVYNNVPFDTFFTPFLNCLKVCFSYGVSTANVDQSMSFICQFLIRITNLEIEEENKPRYENASVLLENVVLFLSECNQSRNFTVRKRTCQFISSLLSCVSHDATLDETLCNKMCNMMLRSLRDKLPIVRLNAVNALYRLQDPNDESCPVTEAYYFHLEHDPNKDVRRTVLNKIGLGNNKSIEKIIGRIVDISENVREDVYVVLSKVPVLRFKIAQRIKLLSIGLKDCHVSVQETVGKVMLPAWLKYLKNNYILLLDSLDICMNPQDIGISALSAVFPHQPYEDIISQLKGLLGDYKVIPVEKLNAETSLFWRCAVGYILNHEDKSKEIDLEDDFCKPELSIMADYIRNYYLNDTSENKKSWEILEQEFVFTQLLELTKILYSSDEVGKLRLKSLINDILRSDKPKMSTIQVLIELFFKIEDNVSDGLLQITECINNLLYPEALEEITDDGSIPQSEKTEFDDDEEDKNSQPDLSDETEKNTELLKNKDPVKILKCLKILNEVGHLKCITKLTPTMHTLFKNLLSPAFSLPNINISSLALETMGSFCLRDEQLAKDYFICFCCQISNEDLCVTALKIVFDLLVFFKPMTFQVKDLDKNETYDLDSDDEKDETGTPKDSEETVTSSIAPMLVALLDDNMLEIRIIAIKGICKLMIAGIVYSPKLLSRLIIIWFHPSSIESVEIQQYLGFFFPFYAKNCLGSKQVFEQAFLPTLRAFFNAPLHNPLSKIDQNTVAKLMVNIINLKVADEINTWDNSHNNLALLICNEMLDITDYSQLLVLVKSLLILDLSSTDPALLSTIQNLTMQLTKKFDRYKDKNCLNYMKKFKICFEELLTKKSIEKLSIASGRSSGIVNFTVNDMPGPSSSQNLAKLKPGDIIFGNNFESNSEDEVDDIEIDDDSD